MRLLLVKTSSLGDVIHNLPVVSDLRRHLPGVTIDWCVEESFAAIPRLHPGVNRVIPVAIRRWRKELLSGQAWRDMAHFRRKLREDAYDFVVDSQGLLKSALLAAQARGVVIGYDRESIREPLASRFYDKRFRVSRQAHAVDRNRQLAALAFGYTPEGPPGYGIEVPPLKAAWVPKGVYVIFLTATSRDDKLWPEDSWVELGRMFVQFGLIPVLPAGTPVEQERAARIARAVPGAVSAPPLNLEQLAGLLGAAQLAVGVDTGLTHLAVALSVPTVALYTASEPGLTGVLGGAYFRNLGGRGRCPTVGEVLAALPPGGW